MNRSTEEQDPDLPASRRPGPWTMAAHRYDDGLFYNVGDRRSVELHGLAEPIVTVTVTEVADDDPRATHWGWLATGATKPVMVSPRWVLFEICFPYGSQIEVDHGKGRALRVAVVPAPATGPTPGVCDGA